MKIYHGRAASPGLAQGPLVFVQSRRNAAQGFADSEPQQEWQRFLTAQDEAIRQLEGLKSRAKAQGQEEAALLMDAHTEMARDPDFIDAVQAGIDDGYAAPSAVLAAGQQFAAVFADMEDAYMQARSADILDVSDRIAGILTGAQAELPVLERPCILAAEDLSPSQTLQLDKNMILGIVTRRGSVQSHSAILARMLGIPALVGVEQLSPEDDNIPAIMDGQKGELLLNPDEETLRRYQQQIQLRVNRQRELYALVHLPTVTASGKVIRLYCNIAEPVDADAVVQNGGEGIGLFRSEFLFLGRHDLPGEEEQLAAYRSVLEKMGQKPVIIRTLDIGADKQVDYLPMGREENPALGLRGLRLCLENPSLFTTQLRALYRASAFGNLAIMFPMVAGLWELQEAKGLCLKVQAQLHTEGIAFSPKVPLGIMIETPAAALISRELAKEADFFSIGTNDLTQYTLACDRQNNALGRYIDPHHPALLELIRMTAESAHEASIPVGICGELAADAEMLDFFLETDIDELSVAPPSVLPLRQAIRSKI